MINIRSSLILLIKTKTWYRVCLFFCSHIFYEMVVIFLNFNFVRNLCTPSPTTVYLLVCCSTDIHFK